MSNTDNTPARQPRMHGFIAALGVGQIVSWGTLFYAFPLIAVPMGEELAIGRPQVYGLATLALVVAGLSAYPIGVAIDRGFGRRVMTAGAVLAGLLLLAWSRLENLAALYVVFAGIGLVQSMTLYEPAFAVVVRRFGTDARRGITSLTLWGGFASTVFVPLIQLLLDMVGWRDTLAVLGLCNLLICAVLYARAIDPTRELPAFTKPVEGQTAAPQDSGVVRAVLRRPPFWALMIAFTVFYATVTSLLYHLYPLLIERNLDPRLVAAVIAVIGPSQVAARVLLMIGAGSLSIRHIGMITASVFPFAFMLLVLPPNAWLVWMFAILFGAANGVMTIVRGMAVPEMVTREAYGAVNGVLAAPTAAAKAFAPVLAATIWATAGTYDAVAVVWLIASIVLAAAFAAAVATSKRT